MASESSNETSRQWEALLSEGDAYHRNTDDPGELRRCSRMTRKLRFFLRQTGLRPPADVFEFGCGNGNQLIPLALAGYRCTGVDVSERALKNMTDSLAVLGKMLGRKLFIEAVHADFINCRPEGLFDLVFHVGVLEHFLDTHTRHSYLLHMFDLARPGGHVVHAVPNGVHPLRALQRSQRWSYEVPEMDYSVESLAEELVSCGGQEVRVFPWNMYGYELIRPQVPIWRKMRYYAWQLLPFEWLPRRLSSVEGYWLAGFARKAFPHGASAACE